MPAASHSDLPTATSLVGVVDAAAAAEIHSLRRRLSPWLLWKFVDVERNI